MFIEVVSPESKLFSGEIKQATLQTYVGEITILPQHMPLVSVIKP
jgi:F0F1-type ATP synthase epsilon subunit